MSIFSIERDEAAVAIEEPVERTTAATRGTRGRGKSWVGTTIRVGSSSNGGAEFVGQILLDTRDRVRRHADSIPSDIVLKILIEYTRHGEQCGKLVGRKDGRLYYWHVVGIESGLEERGETTA
jgi:hypothetical protein